MNFKFSSNITYLHLSDIGALICIFCTYYVHWKPWLELLTISLHSWICYYTYIPPKKQSNVFEVRRSAPSPKRWKTLQKPCLVNFSPHRKLGEHESWATETAYKASAYPKASHHRLACLIGSNKHLEDIARSYNMSCHLQWITLPSPLTYQQI